MTSRKRGVQFVLTVDRNTPCGIESLRARRARLSIHDLTGVFRVVLRLGRGGAVIHESRLTFRSASLGGLVLCSFLEGFVCAVILPASRLVWGPHLPLQKGLCSFRVHHGAAKRGRVLLPPYLFFFVQRKSVG